MSDCLGLTLLYGSILLELGFSPEFKVLLHPKDAVDRDDHKLFQDLFEGVYFPYDNPSLPTLQDIAEHPINHFSSLEHPVVVIGDQTIETTATSPDSNEGDLFYAPLAESVTPVTFEELSSCVYIDRAKNKFMEITVRTSEQLLEIEQLIRKGLEIWKGNREGWALLWGVGKEKNDKNLQNEAREEYKKIGGSDSTFNYTMYMMTGKVEYLDQTLKKYPAHILAFLDKKVFLEKDMKEAKFNMAVAMWCVCNSSTLNLMKFYSDPHFMEKARELYGEEKMDELLKRHSK
jgi:hypothetical protein